VLQLCNCGHLSDQSRKFFALPFFQTWPVKIVHTLLQIYRGMVPCHVQHMLNPELCLNVFNPLSPDIRMHILITDLDTFHMKLVRTFCLNIKTSYSQGSLLIFLSLE